jgi:hypothetical protein
MTGRFTNTVNFGGGDLTSAGDHDIFLAKYDASGVHLWSNRFGSTEIDHAYSVSADNSGNVFVTGEFQGTVNFGGNDLTSAGDHDIFLAKFDVNGNHLWSKHFGSTDDEYGRSASVDTFGNVIIMGNFKDTVNLGGSDLVNAGFRDVFLAKYDANGNHLWSKRFGATNAEYGESISIDNSDNVFVTGNFQGTVNFGGSDLISAGSYDIFLAKYDTNGNHLWSKGFGSTNIDFGHSVTVDSAGNVIATGTFYGVVNFGGDYLMSWNSTGMFIAKYDADGNHLWSKSFSSTMEEGMSSSNSISADKSGNVVIMGYFHGTINFGGINLTSEGDKDIFLAKFNANGNHVWSKRFFSTDGADGYSVSADNSGNVFVTGEFEGTANFGGQDIISAGGDDGFVAKFSP